MHLRSSASKLLWDVEMETWIEGGSSFECVSVMCWLQAVTGVSVVFNSVKPQWTLLGVPACFIWGFMRLRGAAASHSAQLSVMRGTLISEVLPQPHKWTQYISSKPWPFFFFSLISIFRFGPSGYPVAANIQRSSGGIQRFNISPVISTIFSSGVGPVQKI